MELFGDIGFEILMFVLEHWIVIGIGVLIISFVIASCFKTLPIRAEEIFEDTDVDKTENK